MLSRGWLGIDLKVDKEVCNTPLVIIITSLQRHTSSLPYPSPPDRPQAPKHTESSTVEWKKDAGRTIPGITAAAGCNAWPGGSRARL